MARRWSRSRLARRWSRSYVTGRRPFLFSEKGYIRLPVNLLQELLDGGAELGVLAIDSGGYIIRRKTSMAWYSGRPSWL